MQPKRCGIAGFFQVTVGAMIVFYFLNYSKIRKLFISLRRYFFSNLNIFFQNATGITSTTKWCTHRVLVHLASIEAYNAM